MDGELSKEERENGLFLSDSPSFHLQCGERLLKSTISHRGRIVRGAPSFENWAMSICVGWAGGRGGNSVRHRHHHQHRPLRRRLRPPPPQYQGKYVERPRRDPRSFPRSLPPFPTQRAGGASAARRDSFLIELHRGMSTFRVGRSAPVSRRVPRSFST